MAADTSAAATAIANASVAAESASSGKATEVQRPGAAEVMSEEKERLPEPDSNKGPPAGSSVTAQMPVIKQDPREISDGFQNRGLPPEFYHYYYGSSFDMGALIEVCDELPTWLEQLPQLVYRIGVVCVMNDVRNCPCSFM